MYQDIDIKEALCMKDALFIDVRSEDEYFDATIPGAVNIPVFDNIERAAVGTAYRQQGPDHARRIGLELISKKLLLKVEAVDNIAGSKKKINVFCWRGGQRSQFMASLLDAMGYSVYRVKGGYKAYRNYVNEYLNREELCQRAVVLYGLTGVGKTDILELLDKKGAPVLDLEGLARHRGSVYGKIGMPPSPSQKTFESSLVQFLKKAEEDGVFLIECESRRIGNLILPVVLMNTMKKGYQVLIYTDLEKRVERIMQVYTRGAENNIGALKSATLALANRLGTARVNELNRMLDEQKFEAVFTFLLKNYYDPLYKYPDHESDEYDLNVDSTDVEKAAGVVYEYIKSLPEYKSPLGRHKNNGNRQ